MKKYRIIVIQRAIRLKRRGFWFGFPDSRHGSILTFQNFYIILIYILNSKDCMNILRYFLFDS